MTNDLSLHRVVFPANHVFAPERVGWSGSFYAEYGAMHCSITFMAGVNRFMTYVQHESFDETYWGSCEQVIKFIMKSIGTNIIFPDDNMMQQAADRIKNGVEHDLQS